MSTVAVKAALVAFDFRRAHCENVGRFAEILATNMPSLINNGHPKWKAVDLEYSLKGWEQYDCVKKYLRKPVRVATEQETGINPVLEAIKQVLGD